MSTNDLCTLFDLEGYTIMNCRTDLLSTMIEIRSRKTIRKSPCCHNAKFVRNGTVRRQLRTTPIGLRFTLLEVSVQRYRCKACGFVFTEKIDFAPKGKGYTWGLAGYVLELLKSMTIRDVADLVGLHWHTVKEILKGRLLYDYGAIDLTGVKRLLIDEICVGKGYRFLTVVQDADTGRALFVGDGKDAAALDPFWKKLRLSKARIEAVASDLSAAYISAVSLNLPGVAHVFDRFHIVKLFNEKLSGLRRSLARQLGQEDKKILKGSLWLLLKNPTNLDSERNEKERLEEALALNKPLAAAYYMKEELRLLWAQASKKAAETFLADWIARAAQSGVPMLKKFSASLARYKPGILTWYDHRISTGPLEAFNNKIRVLQRKAYGFRDWDFFKLRILSLHKTSSVLVGR